MKKFWWIFFILILIVIGVLVFYFMNKNKDSNNYTANKSNYSTNITNNNTSNDTTNNDITNNNIDESSSENKTKTQEIEIGSFSTKITNKKDTNRQGNITITCNSLNGTEIKPGKIFSFCDTVGEATYGKGYKDANIIVDGEEIKGLGGGNCQISSTLYNAVLMSQELEVVERHPHSAPVPYIEQGKDAAVSYGAYDFKFKNNSDSTIKIVAENTPDNITIRLIKLVVT